MNSTGNSSTAREYLLPGRYLKDESITRALFETESNESWKGKLPKSKIE